MEPKPTPSPESTRTSDSALVRQALAGSKDAFGELVQRYQRPCVAAAYRYLDDSDDAREVAQEAFLKAYRSLGSLADPGAFGGWLQKIAANLALNKRRSRSLRRTASLNESASADRDGQLSDVLPGTELGPQQIAQGHEIGERLKYAMAQLPEKQRMALVLFALENRPQKEVAEVLDCSVEAVKWHVFQARKRLRSLLGDSLETDTDEA